MKTQENLAEKLLGIIEEKDRKRQLSIFNEAESNADMTIPEPKLSEVKAHYRKRTRLTTDKLPNELPVEVIEHELSAEDCICPDCNSKLHTMGRETREEFKIIPARGVIVRHIRHVYSCRNCEGTFEHVPIIKADMPEPVIKGGFASLETIAHIAVQKFMMASPLYRQEQEWKQSGILLSRRPCQTGCLKLVRTGWNPYMKR